MGTDLNKEKQVVQRRNTNLLLDLYCYIIISVIIVTIISDGGVIGGGRGVSSSGVIF